jgi:hypothetical protein
MQALLRSEAAPSGCQRSPLPNYFGRRFVEFACCAGVLEFPAAGKPAELLS